MNTILPLIYDFEKFNIGTHIPEKNSIGMWKNEIECLLWSSLNSQKGNWVEIGSHNGGSAVLLCLSRNSQNRGPKIYTVDINYGRYFDENISNGGYWNIIRKTNGTSKTFKESYPTEPISFAFIDGFHSFKWVIQDFENIVDNLVDEALISFHDVSPHLYQEKNILYLESALQSAKDNYNRWMKDESHNFYVDEAICWLMDKYKLEIISIPIRRFEFYPERTGLQKWVQGTTSPYNSLITLKYRKTSV